MTTLATKYGPDGAEETPAAARARLDAYGRLLRAGLEAQHGPRRAPVQLLSDELLAGLFSPHQLLVLVRAPLAGPRGCEGAGHKD
jgi:hypothetical protein